MKFAMIKLTCLLALPLLALLLPGRAVAGGACHFKAGTTLSTVIFTFAGSSITVPANAQVGDVLATSTVSVTPQPILNCSGNNNVNGINATPALSSNVGTLTTSNTYRTGIPGIGFQIINGDTGIPVDIYPTDTNKNNDIVLPASMTLKLVVTSMPVGTGSMSGSLGSWDYIGNQGEFQVENFQLGSSITVAPASCTVSTQSQNLTVTLPNTFMTAFTGVGSTAGTTPFSIDLNCQAGAAVKITMDTANPDMHQGVIAPSGTGYAAGIGVRILDGSSQPIVFGTQQTVSSSAPAGTFSIPYSAQYFQTSSPAGSGPVYGTLTFTMAYQ